MLTFPRCRDGRNGKESNTILHIDGESREGEDTRNIDGPEEACLIFLQARTHGSSPRPAMTLALMQEPFCRFKLCFRLINAVDLENREEWSCRGPKEDKVV